MTLMTRKGTCQPVSPNKNRVSILADKTFGHGFCSISIY